MQPSRRAAAVSLLATLFHPAFAQGEMVQYTLNLRANFGGTAHALDYEAKPASLKRTFGMPLLNDGDSESMGTYIFVGPTGEVLTLYFRANDVPRGRIEALQQKFWSDEDQYSFSIGARTASHAQPFVKWLQSKLGARPNPSLKLTRYGRHCKPGLRHTVHHLSPGLQYLPPRAA